MLLVKVATVEFGVDQSWLILAAQFDVLLVYLETVDTEVDQSCKIPIA